MGGGGREGEAGMRLCLHSSVSSVWDSSLTANSTSWQLNEHWNERRATAALSQPALQHCTNSKNTNLAVLCYAQTSTS